MYCLRVLTGQKGATLKIVIDALEEKLPEKHGK